jgi:hypothetical protein
VGRKGAHLDMELVKNRIVSAAMKAPSYRAADYLRLLCAVVHDQQWLGNYMARRNTREALDALCTWSDAAKAMNHPFSIPTRLFFDESFKPTCDLSEVAPPVDYPVDNLPPGRDENMPSLEDLALLCNGKDATDARLAPSKLDFEVATPFQTFMRRTKPYLSAQRVKEEDAADVLAVSAEMEEQFKTLLKEARVVRSRAEVSGIDSDIPMCLYGRHWRHGADMPLASIVTAHLMANKETFASLEVVRGAPTQPVAMPRRQQASASKRRRTESGVDGSVQSASPPPVESADNGFSREHLLSFMNTMQKELKEQCKRDEEAREEARKREEQALEAARKREEEARKREEEAREEARRDRELFQKNMADQLHLMTQLVQSVVAAVKK